MQIGSRARKVVAGGIVVLASFALAAPALADPIGYTATTGQNSYSLWRVDLATGNATVVGPFGANLEVYGLSFSPSGVLYGIASDGLDGGQKLWTIDPATGAATLVGATGVEDGSGLSFTPDGRLWMTDFSGTRTLYRLDPATGTATAVASGALGADIEGLAASCDGTLYGIGDGDFPFLYRIDTTTGVASALPQSYSPPLPLIDNAGIDFDAEGTLWGIESLAPGSIFTVDPVTGAATQGPEVTGEDDGGWRSLAIEVTCPPPPIVEIVPTFTG